MNRSPDKPHSTPAQGARLDVIRFGRLALKELRETFRDRRTVVTLVLMPLLVYPLMGLLFQRFALSSAASLNTPQDSRVYRIGVEPGNEDEREFAGELTAALHLKLADEQLKHYQAMESDESDETEPRFSIHPFPQGDDDELDLEQAINNLQIDAGIRRVPGSGAKPRWEILYLEGSPRGMATLNYVEARLAYGELAEQLAARGPDKQLARIYDRTMLKRGPAPPTLSFKTLIPLILILMTITGAVYPAIDLTAGERERGTLESLIAAPMPRIWMLLSKYTAVVSVAMLTAVVNLTAMTITIYSVGLGEQALGIGGFSLLMLLKIFLLLVLFAFFFSAVLLAITSFARTFKEAQSYLIPLMLLSIAPGLFALMPGLRLEGPLSVAPLMNIVLLARDVMEGRVIPLGAAAAVISTLLYALAAIALAARVFGTDAVLAGGQGTWGDFVRRPPHSSPAASAMNAMLLVAVIFAGLFIAVNIIGQARSYADFFGKKGEYLHDVWTQEPQATQANMVLSGLTTAAFFGLLPLAVALFYRIRLREGFRLLVLEPERPARVAGLYLALGLAGAVILAFVLWPFEFEAYIFMEQLGLSTLSQQYRKLLSAKVAALPEAAIPLLLASLAVAPAVCEEWFFRGYLFAALRRKWSPTATIVATALLFGMFHVFTGLLSIERFLPSAAVGLVLGWIAWRSGSVVPGMVLHAIHNSLLLLLVHYQKELTEMGFGVGQSQHIPLAWLAAATVGAAVGGGLIFLCRPAPPIAAADS